MKFNRNIVFYLLCCLLLITQFTNCAPADEGGSDQVSIQGVDPCFLLQNCQEKDPQDLMFTISSPTGSVGIYEGQSSTNLAGNCSTGQFKDHILKWSIQPSDVLYGEYKGACIKGRFNISVNVPPNLALGGVSQSIQLQLFGIDEAGNEVKSKLAPTLVRLQSIPGKY